MLTQSLGVPLKEGLRGPRSAADPWNLNRVIPAEGSGQRLCLSPDFPLAAEEKPDEWSVQ